MGIFGKIKKMISQRRDRMIREMIDRVYFRVDKEGRRYIAGTLLVEDDILSHTKGMFRSAPCSGENSTNPRVPQISIR